MGNHEYCEECGASDFHYGRDCEPTRKATFQAGLREVEERNKRATEAAKEAVIKLRGLGYKPQLDQFDNITISKHTLIED